MKIKKIYFLVLFFLSFLGAKAQNVDIKTNLLYDAFLTPNLGIEVGLAPKWSVEITGNLNNWEINNKRWKQWMVQPEARYWFCRRFAGHFLALHGIAGQYNFGNINFGGYNFLGTNLKMLEDHRVQGWMAGAGIGYGYTWILSRHWSFEAEIGLGWIYTRYDEFKCQGCGQKIKENVPHNYFGPTKAALNLIYVF